MALTVTLLGVLVVASSARHRYSTDSRTSGDPTGRDAAWPTGPVREHAARGRASPARGSPSSAAGSSSSARCVPGSRSVAPAPVRTGTSPA